jgi:hypothetical protein
MGHGEGSLCERPFSGLSSSPIPGSDVAGERGDCPRIFEAFNRTFTNGTDDLYALLDPDVEWVPVMAILEGCSYHRPTRGCGSGSRDMKRDWEAFEARPEDFRDLGDDRALALGSWRARGRAGGELLNIPQAARLGQYRDGNLVRMQTFTERKAGPRSRRAVGVGDVARPTRRSPRGTRSSLMPSAAPGRAVSSGPRTRGLPRTRSRSGRSGTSRTRRPSMSRSRARRPTPSSST